MGVRMLHDRDLTPTEAIQIQGRLCQQRVLDQASDVVHILAGVDVSFSIGSNVLYGAIVLLDLSDAIFTKNDQKIATYTILESGGASLKIHFPSIPGLLSFREILVVLKAWEKLNLQTDCIICEGQGVAHHLVNEARWKAAA